MQPIVCRLLLLLWISLISGSESFAPKQQLTGNLLESYHISPFVVQPRHHRISRFHRHFKMKAKEGSTQLELSNNKVLSKIGSSTSAVVAGTFFVVLAYQRDCFMLTFFIGSILNAITSKVLKKILNQDRPSGYENEKSVKVKPSDKGMPSSHAMSLGFIGVYTATALCNGILMEADIAVKIVTCLILILYVALSLSYRVQSQLHTTAQVIVGLIVGSKFVHSIHCSLLLYFIII